MTQEVTWSVSECLCLCGVEEGARAHAADSAVQPSPPLLPVAPGTSLSAAGTACAGGGGRGGERRKSQHTSDTTATGKYIPEQRKAR